MAENQVDKVAASQLEERHDGYDSDSSQATGAQESLLSWSSEDDSLYADEKSLPVKSDLRSSPSPPPAYEEVIAKPSPTTGSTVYQEYGVYYMRLPGRAMVFATRTSNPSASTASPSKGKGKKIESEKSLKTPVCVVKLSTLRSSRPELTLCGLPDGFEPSPMRDLSRTPGNGPTRGIVRLSRIGRHIQVGLGDPKDFIASHTSAKTPASRAGEDGLNWIEVKNPNVTSHMLYTFTLEGREYEWRRTRDTNHGVEGGAVARALTLYSYVLVDVAGGEDIAVFLETAWRSVKKAGTLKILRELDDTLWLAVTLSCAGILEKQRRRGGG